MRRIAITLAALAVLALGTTAALAAGPGHQSGYQHVWIVMMENTGADQLIGNPKAPWTNQAIRKYGYASSYYGVTHPSQPNYIAITSGSTNGVVDDNEITIDVPNIVDQLEAHGKTWHDYQQSYALCTDPLQSQCGDQLYERKHNPFVSYLDVQSSPARMANVVDLSQLDANLASGNVANYNFIAPDQCHDMHGRSTAGDCNFGNVQGLIKTGDKFLRDLVHTITSSSSWEQGSVIFVTWDESEFPFDDVGGCCDAIPGGGRVVTVAISSRVDDPVTSSTPYNHYSMLGTIEDLWGLGCLDNTCDRADVPRMTDLLTRPHH